ncbi:MAG: oligoribonuclease [Lentisphaeraceae bacterium]|nr:oligoribonuclease [Lentisphaeraceae bacterium]
MPPLKTPLVWLDLEMTGLCPEKDCILEIATIITDGDLNIIAEGPEIVVHQPEEELAKMNAWCVKQHGASGLTEKVRQSEISLAEAEKQTVKFIKKHTGRTKVPLCGNSIGQDRMFLLRYMPRITNQLHYRMVDVSSIKEMAKRWYPGFTQYEKKATHRAMDDIRESIAELKHYRELLFVDKLASQSEDKS